MKAAGTLHLRWGRVAILCGVAMQGLTEKVTVEGVPGDKEGMVISGGRRLQAEEVG